MIDGQNPLPDAESVSTLRTNRSTSTMENTHSTVSAAGQDAARLKTTFATREQAASLIETLDLTPGEIDQVSGGLPLDVIVRPVDCIVLPQPDCIVPPRPDCIILQRQDVVVALG
jgi:hypothetical protein